MKIQTFIFNWRNQYLKTIEKEKQFKLLGIEPIVINSDDEHKEQRWYNIGEDSYFTAQFLKALELFDGDVLFHIQADASYNDWDTLLKDAEKYISKYGCGIYAPNVDYTWYDSGKTDIPDFRFEEENLSMVATTDCTCWFINKEIIDEADRLKIDFSPYKMGWSFDIVYPAISFLNKRPVIRDYSHTIDHPAGTNYNKVQAESEMYHLFSVLPNEIKEPFSLIKGDRFQLRKYYE